MGHRAGLDGCGISRAHRDSIPRTVQPVASRDTECKSSLNTTSSTDDEQLHVSAIHSHLLAEYRFIIGENI